MTGVDPLFELGGESAKPMARENLAAGLNLKPMTKEQLIAAGRLIRGRGQPQGVVTDGVFAELAAPAIVGTAWERRHCRAPEFLEVHVVQEFSDNGMTPLERPSMLLFEGLPCVRVRGNWRASKNRVWSLRRFLELMQPEGTGPVKDPEVKAARR